MQKPGDISHLILEQRKLSNENIFLREQLNKKERQINELFQHIFKLSKEMEELAFQLLSSVSLAMEMRDGFTCEFAHQTAEYGVKVARALGLGSEDTELIRRASYLLEIGRIGIKEDIFTKIGKLTEQEYEKIKSHPGLGENILKPIKFLEGILPIVRHHHERYDGNGYPDGLGGKQIPVGSRITCSCKHIYCNDTAQTPQKSAQQRTGRT